MAKSKATARPATIAVAPSRQLCPDTRASRFENFLQNNASETGEMWKVKVFREGSYYGVPYDVLEKMELSGNKYSVFLQFFRLVSEETGDNLDEVLDEQLENTMEDYLIAEEEEDEEEAEKPSEEEVFEETVDCMFTNDTLWFVKKNSKTISYVPYVEGVELKTNEFTIIDDDDSEYLFFDFRMLFNGTPITYYDNYVVLEKNEINTLRMIGRWLGVEDYKQLSQDQLISAIKTHPNFPEELAAHN